jgi:FkbM family methyltransferase
MHSATILTLIVLCMFGRFEGTTFPQSTINIPQYLLDLGESMFGSKRSTLEVIGNMSTPRLHRFGGSRVSLKGPMRGQTLVTLVQFQNDNTINKLVHEFGKHDKYALRNITRNSSEIMIDIGANIGLVSIVASKMHKRLAIIAFEAVPTTYFFLRCNLHLNKIRVLQASDFIGGSPMGGVYPVYGALIGDDEKGHRDSGHAAKSEPDTERTIEVRYMNSRSQFAFAASSDPTQIMKHTHQNGVRLSVALVRAYSLLSFLVTLFAPPRTSALTTTDKFSPEATRLDLRGVPVIALLKIDCEGCEFAVIPSIAEIFTNRSAVRMVAGEYHVALGDKDTTTVATKPSDELLNATAEVMRTRGCDTTSWEFMC